MSRLLWSAGLVLALLPSLAGFAGAVLDVYAAGKAADAAKAEPVLTQTNASYGAGNGPGWHVLSNPE